jgi:hypothetical protein
MWFKQLISISLLKLANRLPMKLSRDLIKSAFKLSNIELWGNGERLA